MTILDFKALLREIDWFGRLGEPDVEAPYVRLPTLAPWAGMSTKNPDIERIADEMEWLPSSRGQVDPFHGRSLEQRADASGNKLDMTRQIAEVYKTALESLRRFERHGALKVGPHDFTEAARGAALFAARRAACEILVGETSIWCELMNVYHSVHWPCGILLDRRIVVL